MHLPFSERFHIPRLLILGLLIVALSAAFVSQYLQKPRQQVTGAPVQVMINTGKPGVVIPADFASFSFEPAQVCSLVSDEEQSSTLANLFANLGSATFRFGGNSVEQTYWSLTETPSCSYTSTVVTPSVIDGIFALAKKLHWKVIWGENLKNGSPTSDADEARYVVASGGASLLALEIGNEPDLYGWEYSTFKSKWDTFARAIQAETPSAPLSGPALCCRAAWFTNFLSDDGSQIVLATSHLYPMGINNPSQTIPKLLSPKLMSDMALSTDQGVSAAKAHHLPLQIDESNNIANGGTPGVSNVFASALWGADYLFTAAQHGAVGVNLHGGGGASYEPIHIAGNAVFARPLYYAMLFFHYAAGNGRLIPIQVHSPLNITGYGVVGTDGKLRVALINKEQSQSVTMHIHAVGSYTRASLIRLAAPSVSASSGVTLGGSAVATDGTWAPKTVEPVSINNGSSSVFLPAASGLVVTFENGNSASSAFSSPKASPPMLQQPASLHLLFKQEQQTVLLFLFSPSILSLPRRKLQKRDYRTVKLDLKREEKPNGSRHINMV